LATRRVFQGNSKGSRFFSQECASWTKDSHASDHAERPYSRGLPNGNACPDRRALTEIGPRHFSSAHKGAAPAVGDQFVLYSWKGMSYVVANSSAVLTQVRKRNAFFVSLPLVYSKTDALPRQAQDKRKDNRF
jgi:hypothetical protein